MNAPAKRYYGFVTRTTKTQRRTSVVMIDGSAHCGFATEATARAKLDAHMANESYSVNHAGTEVVIAFDSQNEAYKYLRDVNDQLRYGASA